MSKSTRYFQVTPDILLEYNYTTHSVLSKNNQTGDVSDGVIDLNGKDKIILINDNYDSKRYFLINDSDDTGINADKSNFVIPISSSNSKFIRYFEKQRDNTYKTYSDSKIIMGDSINHPNDFDVVFDNIRLHYTSRNYMGEYDALIFQASIIKSNKEKINLLSFISTRLDNIKLNANPMLINQKLYTSYNDFKILSTETLLNYNKEYGIKSDILESNERLMKNTPIIFEVYGVKNTLDYGGFDLYKCERISNISIPSIDSYDNVSISIEEADDGDYFIIKPVVDSGETFSDFIRNIDENPENYVILHELSLTEYYIDANNMLQSEVTHKEHYVVNAAVDEDDVMVINEDALEEELRYRPICKKGSKCIRFVITDILRIVNTKDNTTIVKKASLEYKKPYKYGLRMNKIYIGEQPVNVNVYNKRTNVGDYLNDDVINFSSSAGSVKVNGTNTIETKTITVTAFCETTNIRVTVME